MTTFMLSFGRTTSVDPDGRRDDGRERRDAALRAAFELGVAWHGGQSAVFLRTAKSAEDVFQHVARLLDDRDLLLLVEIADGAEVRVAGNRFDEEGFDRIFPSATEVEDANTWAPFRSPSEEPDGGQPPISDVGSPRGASDVDGVGGDATGDEREERLGEAG